MTKIVNDDKPIAFDGKQIVTNQDDVPTAPYVNKTKSIAWGCFAGLVLSIIISSFIFLCIWVGKHL